LISTKKNKKRVLIVCAGANGTIAPFVLLQKKYLEQIGVDCSIFPINRKGISGYLSRLPAYWKMIKETNPDTIHSHYVLSGLFSLMQFKKPVIISFIGSDIMLKRWAPLSYFTMFFTKYSVFVSRALMTAVPFAKKNFRVVPYGIDIDNFVPIDKYKAREQLGLEKNETYCLFPALKHRPEKNYSLAEQALNKIGNIKVLEIGHNLPIEKLNLIFNAADFMLLTSFHEGGPQVVFEGMSINLPIVSTDVGMVKESIKDLPGCYICSYDVEDVEKKIRLALSFNGRTEGRKRIEELNLHPKPLAQLLSDLY
jgi:teichuronic acid biosynthesis glycosyltransferase TuaC